MKVVKKSPKHIYIKELVNKPIYTRLKIKEIL